MKHDYRKTLLSPCFLAIPRKIFVFWKKVAVMKKFLIILIYTLTSKFKSNLYFLKKRNPTEFKLFAIYIYICFEN